jgi:hypothetical protein
MLVCPLSATVGAGDDGIQTVPAPLTTSSFSASFLGGSGDDGFGVDLAVDVAVDSDGRIYVASITNSSDLPMVPGCYTCQTGGGTDILLAKFSPDLSALLAMTVIGGGGEEAGVAIRVGPGNSIYVMTRTFSTDYPTTPGVFSRSLQGAVDFAVSVFDSDLTELVASSYFGGYTFEAYPVMDLNTDGEVFVGGLVSSSGFPTTVGAYCRAYGGGNSDFFVAKLSANLQTLLGSTYLGGRYMEEFPTVAVGQDGDLFISGRSESDDYPSTSGAYDETFGGPPAPGEYLHDMVVSRLSSDLTELVASTFVGGPDYDGAILTAVDPSGNVVVAGHTSSPDYPVTPGAFDVGFNGFDEFFITKLDPLLSTVIASTFLSPENHGITDAVFGNGLACLADGSVLMIGQAWGADMPTTDNGHFQSFSGGTNDAMIFQLSQDLAVLQYGSYLGGSGSEMYATGGSGPEGNLIAVGNTASSDFPVTSGAYDEDYSGGLSDLFVVRFGVSCCQGRVGDINSSGDDEPTIGDVSTLIDLLFISQNQALVSCAEEADINQSGGPDPDIEDLTIGDVSRLIDYLFVTGQSLGLPDCL